MTSPANVLLIERDESDFHFLNSALRRSPAVRRVHWAHDADDACAYLAGVDGYAERAIFPLPDLVLVDLRRSGTGELEFVRWLRSSSEVAHVPVVALTAAHNPSDWEKARELGVNGVHLRPADPQRLRDLMERLVGIWLQRSPAAAVGSYAA